MAHAPPADTLSFTTYWITFTVVWLICTHLKICFYLSYRSFTRIFILSTQLLTYLSPRSRVRRRCVRAVFHHKNLRLTLPTLYYIYQPYEDVSYVQYFNFYPVIQPLNTKRILKWFFFEKVTMIAVSDGFPPKIFSIVLFLLHLFL